MVKLTEVEDEHFTDKPIPTKGDALLVSDDEEDYTDTGKCLTNNLSLQPFKSYAYIALGSRYQHPSGKTQLESICPRICAPNPTSPE